MLEFLQGFAYGLLLSSIPWFLIGMVAPHIAVPSDPPRRWKAWLRYGLAVPFIALLLWLTSLWGGFGPSLGGWIAGLAAIAIEVPLERRWRRWQSQRRQRRQEAEHEKAAQRLRMNPEREQREAGMFVLDPAQPPVGADEIVLSLCTAKQRLLDLRRPELALQADRLYTRYSRVLEALENKFDTRELTFERSRGMVAEVSRSAVNNLATMASLANGIASVDTDFVRRKLSDEGAGLPAQERQALTSRLALVENTAQRLRELSAANEEALTALDHTTLALAHLDTERPQASLSADQALQDLRRFIDKAELYGRQPSGRNTP